jgi:hypothetical protein
MGQEEPGPTSTIDAVRRDLSQAADKTSKAVEEGIQAASYATKSGIVLAQEEYSHLRDRSQVLGGAHLAL